MRAMRGGLDRTAQGKRFFFLQKRKELLASLPPEALVAACKSQSTTLVATPTPPGRDGRRRLPNGGHA
jgi:hypothetical protein